MNFLHSTFVPKSVPRARTNGRPLNRWLLACKTPCKKFNSNVPSKIFVLQGRKLNDLASLEGAQCKRHGKQLFHIWLSLSLEDSSDDGQWSTVVSSEDSSSPLCSHIRCHDRLQHVKATWDNIRALWQKLNRSRFDVIRALRPTPDVNQEGGPKGNFDCGFLQNYLELAFKIFILVFTHIKLSKNAKNKIIFFSLQLPF